MKEVNSQETKVKAMSDGQILEVVFNKEEWNEEVYSLASKEAKVRGLDLVKPPEEIQQKRLEIVAAAEEPLEFKWKLFISLSPFGTFSFLLQEKFHINGNARKARESKNWMLGSILFWLIAPFVINKLVWMF